MEFLRSQDWEEKKGGLSTNYGKRKIELEIQKEFSGNDEGSFDFKDLECIVYKSLHFCDISFAVLVWAQKGWLSWMAFHHGYIMAEQ